MKLNDKFAMVVANVSTHKNLQFFSHVDNYSNDMFKE